MNKKFSVFTCILVSKCVFASYHSYGIKSDYNCNMTLPNATSRTIMPYQKGHNSRPYSWQMSASNSGLQTKATFGVSYQHADFVMKLRNFQKHGDKLAIQNEIAQLKDARFMIGKRYKIELATSILQEPITDILSTIKHGTLAEAQEAVRSIFRMSPYKYLCNKEDFGLRYEGFNLYAEYMSPEELQKTFEYRQQYYQDKYTFDIFQEAKQLYENRDYAPYISGYNVGFSLSKVPQSVSSHSKQLMQETASNLHVTDALPSQLSQQYEPLYQELYDNVSKNCALLQDKIGFVTDYYQSREQALKQMISGDHTIYEQTHNLSSQAQHILQSHGFDSAQFTQCKGNLVQQDTNAKLVQTLNDLAHKNMTTRTARQMKEGVLECVQASSQFNQNGNVKEAILLSDFCHVAVEYLWQGMSMGVEIGKGVADGLYVGVSSEIAQTLRDPHALQGAILTVGDWIEPDLRTQVAMETSALVSDLLRIMKDTGEVAFSGVLGVGDAISGIPELAGDCIEVTKLTVECLAPLAKETLYLMDAAERKNVDDFQKYLTNVQYEYGRLSQGVSTFMGQLKDQKSCANGQITKADAKYWARSGARMATEYIMFEQALKGASKVMKGVSTYLKSTESALGQLQHMKDVSGAQVRNVLLAAQLEGSEPLLHMSSLSGKSAAVEQVIRTTTLAAEARVSSVAPIMEKSIAKSIMQQSEASSSSLLTQKVGQYLSLEPKPGYILIPRLHADNIMHSQDLLASLQRANDLKGMKEIWLSIPNIKETVDRCNNLKKATGGSTATTYYTKDADILKLDLKAKDTYLQIRNTDDTKLMSEKLGLQENIIQQVKEHVFLKEHKLWDNFKQFDPDLDMASAWDRLVNGDFYASDLDWFQHELAESYLMMDSTIDWRTAHDMVNKTFSWKI